MLVKVDSRKVSEFESWCENLKIKHSKSKISESLIVLDFDILHLKSSNELPKLASADSLQNQSLRGFKEINKSVSKLKSRKKKLAVKSDSKKKEQAVTWIYFDIVMKK